MSKPARIPTPAREHWRRFRYQMVPVLTFGLIALGTWWLWDRQHRIPVAVGEVEAVRVDLVGQQPGQLGSLNVALYDPVNRGDAVALLDDRLVRTRMQTLQGELEALARQIDATRQQVKIEAAAQRSDIARETRRRMVNVETIRLDLLDRRLRQEVATVELDRLNFLVENDRKLMEQNLIPTVRYNARRLERDALAEEVRQNRGVISELREQLAEAESRLGEAPEEVAADVETMLAPIRAQMQVKRSEIDELRLEADSLVLRAPIAGTVCAIYRRPGQNVMPGDPIATIAAEAGGHVLGYLPETASLKPKPGMAVLLQSRKSPGAPLETRIALVGPQVERMPMHLQRDPTVPQWGLPVMISLPPTAAFKPGELVDITILPTE